MGSRTEGDAMPDDDIRSGPSRVTELRVVVRVPDVPALVAALREDLGLEEVARFGEGDADAVLLEVGGATIEIGNQAHTDGIDEIETGRRGSPQLRLALEVADTAAATEALASRPGVRVLGGPARTPWGSVNARLSLADGVEVTLFESQDGPEPLL